MMNNLTKRIANVARSGLTKKPESKSVLGSMAVLGRRKYATEEKKPEENKSQEVSVQKEPVSGELSARPESDAELWSLDNTDRWWMSEFNRMQRQMDNMFRMFDPFGGRNRSLFDRFDPFQDVDRSLKSMQTQMKFNPTIDVAETDKEITVHAELPGLKKEDVKISLHDGVLEIKGEKKFEKKEGDDKKIVKFERRYGSFLRRIPVPREADASQVKAKFENGVLEVQLPKPESKKPAEVQIE